MVCGRQSKLNKMGHLRNTSRNTDATTRLQDPFTEDEPDPQKSLRFRKSIKPLFDAALGGIIAGTLMFCAAKQILNFYTSGQMRDFAIPWMRSNHFLLLNNLPTKFTLQTKQQVEPHKGQTRSKVQQKSKNKNKGK